MMAVNLKHSLKSNENGLNRKFPIVKSVEGIVWKSKCWIWVGQCVYVDFQKRDPAYVVAKDSI